MIDKTGKIPFFSPLYIQLILPFRMKGILFIEKPMLFFCESNRALPRLVLSVEIALIAPSCMSLRISSRVIAVSTFSRFSGLNHIRFSPTSRILAANLRWLLRFNSYHPPVSRNLIFSQKHRH